MANIIFTGDTSATSYGSTSFPDAIGWLMKLDIIGLDTETNVVDSLLNRKLKVISISNEEGSEIWVIEWEHLNIPERTTLLKTLKSKLCIIQNVSFDYKMFAKEGVKLEKVWDTMLAEQVLTNGLSSEKGYHGLQGILLRRFNIDISKEEQLTFGEGPYSDRQIKYAAIDVLKLGALRKIQISEMKAYDKRINQVGNKGLLKTMWWENEFVKVVADMETTGVRLDKDKWYAIEDAVKPIYEKELSVLNDLVKQDFRDTLELNDWISSTDDFTCNVWSSSAKKKIVLENVYDFEVEKTAKTELKKYLQEHDPKFPEGLKLSGRAWNESDYPATLDDKFAILKLLVLNSKDWDATEHLNGFLLTNLKSLIIEQGWLRPANTLTLNWGSPAQRLKIFQAISPAILSTGKDVIIDFSDKHPIIEHYLNWSETEYQLKNFGKKFYDNHVELDGKHRTRFNQVLATGRLSSVSPNLLNIPRKNGGVYREAVIPDSGFDMLDADYSSQELVIVATIAGETSWLTYLEKGWDLHSKNAELIFGDEWLDAAEPDCAYYKVNDTEDVYDYKKCSCPKHQALRDDSKAVSFGSVYGISYFKLAFNLKIPEDRAKFILKRFFEICPNIANMMVRFGNYAIHNGHIIEPVFGRVRFFDSWKLSVAAEHGAIERAAFNTPIDFVGIKSRELLGTPMLKDVHRTISSQAA